MVPRIWSTLMNINKIYYYLYKFLHLWFEYDILRVKLNKKLTAVIFVNKSAVSKLQISKVFIDVNA
jgi:hypothetical protein